MAKVVKYPGYVGRKVEILQTEHRHCPICDGCDGGIPRCDVIYRVPADPPLAECDVVICNNCGFTFSDTPTTQAEFDRYYAASERYGDEVTGAESWNAGRYAITAARLSDLLPRASRECPAVLDIGGSSGFVHRLQLHGINGRAVDTPLAEVKCVGAKAGCVTLCHVLEHVRDLDPAMRNLAAIAETVYAEVPDAARYHEFCVPPGSDFNSEHVNHFSIKHLQTLFERHGFDLAACGEYNCYPNNFPCIWGFFRRHRSLPDAIRVQCGKRAEMLVKYKKYIADVPGQLIPWGIGELAIELKDILAGRVAYAVDRMRVGEYCGAPIVRPGEHKGDGTIVITGVQHSDAILGEIKAHDYKNEVVVLK